MSKPKQPESYEVTEYTSEVSDKDINEQFKVIKQIVQDKVREVPNMAFGASMSNGKLKLFFNDYEINLPSKLNAVRANAEEALKQLVKHIKKEFKVRTGKDVKLTEKKDFANYQVEKVSLNERYRYLAWKVFELG